MKNVAKQINWCHKNIIEVIMAPLLTKMFHGDDMTRLQYQFHCMFEILKSHFC